MRLVILEAESLGKDMDLSGFSRFGEVTVYEKTTEEECPERVREADIVICNKVPIEGKKVVCLVSGGNIDVNILNRVITRGLVMSGRKANLTIALEDKPGQLQQVADIVSRCGSNVVSVLHDGSDPNMPISSCFLKLTLETRDNAQIEQIRQELTKAGFQLVAERV